VHGKYLGAKYKRVFTMKIPPAGKALIQIGYIPDFDE